MALTQSQIIEIQESAKFNHLRRLREIEERAELEEKVEKAIEARKAEPKTAPKPSAESEKKGK